jgi:hypothetical protein
MQSLAWERLFRAIPEEYRNTLSVVTRTGIEIAVQAFMRIEKECVAIRGRLSGSQETGRIFFVPYEQIDYIVFQREMKETEFAEIFAPLEFPERPATTPATLAAETLPSLQPIVPGAEEPALTPTTAGTPSRMSLPIKSEVLERFRNRTTPTNGAPLTVNGNPPPTEQG